MTLVTVSSAANVGLCIIQEKEALTVKAQSSFLPRVRRSCVNIITIFSAQITSMSLFPLNGVPSVLIMASPSGTKWAMCRPSSIKMAWPYLHKQRSA